jgi:hypothetical protein
MEGDEEERKERKDKGIGVMKGRWRRGKERERKGGI